MAIPWSSLTFTPSDEAVEQLFAAWSWLFQISFTPVLFSILGDAFLKSESGDVYWLETGTGDLTRVADSVDSFRDLLKTDLAEDWFLPTLVTELHAAGKIPKEGCCYSLVILPIFKEGKYEVGNLNPISAQEHFSITGMMHKEIHSLPDGATVKIKIAS
jgi:Domain of unknown function (DUF1851)